MKKEEFLKLAERFTKGQCTQAEESKVIYFFEELQKRTTIDLTKHEAEVSVRISNKIEHALSEKKRKDKKAKKSFRITIAASLAIFIGLGYLLSLLFIPNEISYTTAFGERKEITLPDGSVVMLNAGSTLKYPEKFYGKKREVYLDGEGFFKIQKNELKPFLAHTAQLDIQVLGTSFNINAFTTSREAKVSVATGKVKISQLAKEFDSQFLIHDEQLTYNRFAKTMVKSKNPAYNDIAWTTNTLLLDNASIEQVVEKLEKWFDVSIMLKNQKIKDQKLNGSYKNPVLIDVLESLKFLADITYEYKSENEILIN